MFGNLSPPEEAIVAVEETLRSGKYHGYAPSAGIINVNFLEYLNSLIFDKFINLP